MLMPCSLRTSVTLDTPLSDAPPCLAWDPPEVSLTTHLGLAEQRQVVGQALVAALVTAFCGKGTQRHINETKQSCLVGNNSVFILCLLEIS